MNGKRRVRSEIIIVIALSLFMLALNAAPWIMRLLNNPPGRIFIPFHNSIGDYPSYTAYIKEGIDGAFLVHNPFTVVPHPGGVIFILYVFLGKIWGILGLRDAHIVYHLSRYILGALWFFVLYRFLRRVITGKFERITAFFFILTSASVPFWAVVNGKPAVSWFMTWWTEFDPIARSAFLPHYLVGHMLLLLSLGFMLDAAESSRKKALVMASVCGWFAGLIHTPSLIILLLILPVYGVLTRNIRLLRNFILFAAFSVTSLLWVNWQSQQFPWTVGRAYESMSFAVSLRDLMLGLGPVVLFGIAGAVLQRKSRMTLLFVLWAGVSVGMVVLTTWMQTLPYAWLRTFPLSNIRFFQTAMWVPLGILSAGAFNAARVLRKPAVIILFSVYISITFFGYPAALARQYRDMQQYDDYHAPKTEWPEALSAIVSLNLPGPVLSLPWTGALIPSYTGKTAFVGQEMATPDYRQQLSLAYTFIRGLPVCDAYNVVRGGKVGTVFYSFDEQRAGDGLLQYPFLYLERTFGDTKVFSVGKTVPVGCK